MRFSSQEQQGLGVVVLGRWVELDEYGLEDAFELVAQAPEKIW